MAEITGATAPDAEVITLADGGRILVRPLLPSDRDELAQRYIELSPEARRLRFFNAPDHLSTRLLLTPGRSLHWSDALLTNFHLPRSTLMALVGAMLQSPDEAPAPDGTPIGIVRLKAAYREAIGRGYRFYSFGDAMLVL